MKHGGYKSEQERKLLEPRDSGPNEALDDFELSLDVKPKAPRATKEAANVTLSSLFIVCSHGRRSAHNYWLENAGKWSDEKWCPGGRPVTLEDLGGYRVWRCDARNEIYDSSPDVGPPTIPHWCEAGSSMAAGHENCDWYLLIPLPQMVAQAGEND